MTTAIWKEDAQSNSDAGWVTDWCSMPCGCSRARPMQSEREDK